MDQETRGNANARLKRIAGQVSGIQRTIDEAWHCVDVLLQVAAFQAALTKAGRVVLSGHFESCLMEAMRSRDERERRKKLAELSDEFSRFCRMEGPPAGESTADGSIKETRSRGRGR